MFFENFPADLSHFFPGFGDGRSRVAGSVKMLPKTLRFEGFHHGEQSGFGGVGCKSPATGLSTSAGDQTGSFEFVKNLCQKTGWYCLALCNIVRPNNRLPVVLACKVHHCPACVI